MWTGGRCAGDPDYQVFTGANHVTHRLDNRPPDGRSLRAVHDPVRLEFSILSLNPGAEARAGKRAGALHHLGEHGLEVEARADVQARRAERGDARAQGLVLALVPVRPRRPATLPRVPRSLSRAIFDRYNIIHEQELLEAGD